MSGLKNFVFPTFLSRDNAFCSDGFYDLESIEDDYDEGCDYDCTTQFKINDSMPRDHEIDSNSTSRSQRDNPLTNLSSVHNYGISNYTQLRFVEHLAKTRMIDTAFIETLQVNKDFNLHAVMEQIKDAGGLVGFRQHINEENKASDFYVVYQNLYVKGVLATTNIGLQIGSWDQELLTRIKNQFTPLSIDDTKYCQWSFARGLDIMEMRLPVKKPKPCTSNHVPWLNADVDIFCKGYLDSESSILILLGPPGTGKTSLINHIISAFDRMAMITYDREVMNRDSFYIDFISDARYDLLILEDADPILHRKEGERSEVLSKILNVGDGLVNISNKKIIITANLDSIEDVDPAIARKGRCYDIISSRPMLVNEANALSLIEGGDHVFESEITLAEFYNGRNAIKRGNRKFGFAG